MVKASIKKSDLILLLLHGDDSFPIEGMTRFEKLVFLTQKEVLEQLDEIKLKFNFEPDRFGPLATELYDEIDFLKSVDMVKEESPNRFTITEKGKRFVGDKISQRVHEKLRTDIESIKNQHGKEKLDDLLKYVYSNFPYYTVKSEIRDEVLG